MSDSAPANAPWFYRRRFMVFALLYAGSFVVGYLITGVAAIPAVPVYRYVGYPAVLLTLAVLAVLGGFCLRIWASSYLSSDIVSGGGPRVSELRVSGPYRFTRNPLYLGNVLQAAGIALITPWPVSVLIFGGILAFSYALISVEEPFLAERQADVYARYRAAVGRLFPLPWKIAPASAQPASLREGLRTEATIGLLAAIMFAIALTNTVWLPSPGR